MAIGLMVGRDDRRRRRLKVDEDTDEAGVRRHKWRNLRRVSLEIRVKSTVYNRHGEYDRHRCQGNPWAKSSGKLTLRSISHPYALHKYLVETVIRSRIYEAQYWKEHCFALTGE